MKTIETIPFTDLYTACNSEGWFTCGSNAQYDKLFKVNASEATLHDLALIIWLCSDEKEVKDIEAKLTEIARKLVQRADSEREGY